MRVLFLGDLAATGFGTVTSDLGRAMIELGADMRFVSQNEIPELAEPFRSRTVDVASLVTSESTASGTVERTAEAVEDLIPSLLEGRSTASLVSGEPWGGWKPEAVIMLGDFAAARIFAQPYLSAFAQLPTFHYVPIEGTDLPPKWSETWAVLKPVAMSRFGRAEIEKVTGARPPLVYHGVDAETFHPVSPSEPLVIDLGTKKITLTSKAACKAFFGGDPRQTWVLRTDRHMPRKGYNRLLRAMAPILEERPSVRLVLHCSLHDQGGFLPDSVSKLSQAAQAGVMLTKMHGIPRDVLVALYNAADLYVSTSAEGFGLTIAEAIACGVPVVGLDYSAVPEVVGPAGVVVAASHLIDNEYDHFWAVPDEAEFGRDVAYMLDHPHKRLEFGRQGPAHVRKNFRWDVAAQRFLDIVEGSQTVSEPRREPERELVAA